MTGHGNTDEVGSTDNTGSTDTIRTSGGHRAVHLEREYPTTPQDLWSAWTAPDRLARWLGTPAGPVVGATGPVRIRMGDEDDEWVDLQIVTSEEPLLLELSWEFSGEPAGTLRVEFVPITAARTRLILDHNGLHESSTGYGAGWQAFLDGPLAALFASATSKSWDDAFAEALPTWRARAEQLG